jgi:hypothetical protein
VVNPIAAPVAVQAASESVPAALPAGGIDDPLNVGD